VVHPSSGIPDFSPFPLTRVRAARGLRGRPCSPSKTQVAQATDGFTHGRVTGKGQCPLQVEHGWTRSRVTEKPVTTCHRPEGQQGGCLPSFPATFPAPGFAATQMDRPGCIRWGSTPPCATSIPLLPHRRRRWVPPRFLHPSTTTSLTLRPKEHRSGCRPSFPLAHFSPTGRRGYADGASCLRQSVLSPKGSNVSQRHRQSPKDNRLIRLRNKPQRHVRRTSPDI
jgi:hypothetical protein